MMVHAEIEYSFRSLYKKSRTTDLGRCGGNEPIAIRQRTDAGSDVNGQRHLAQRAIERSQTDPSQDARIRHPSLIAGVLPRDQWTLTLPAPPLPSWTHGRGWDPDSGAIGERAKQPAKALRAIVHHGVYYRDEPR